MSIHESLGGATDPEFQAKLDQLAEDLMSPGPNTDPVLHETLRALHIAVSNPTKCVPPILGLEIPKPID